MNEPEAKPDVFETVEEAERLIQGGYIKALLNPHLYVARDPEHIARAFQKCLDTIRIYKARIAELEGINSTLMTETEAVELVQSYDSLKVKIAELEMSNRGLQNAPAFPTPDYTDIGGIRRVGSPGLTKREEFAKTFAAAIRRQRPGLTSRQVADGAIIDADALIAALNEETP